MNPLNDSEWNDLISAGHEVLQVFPPKAGACVMMSALYVGRLHDLGHRSARLIGGMLAIGDTIVFGRSGVTKSFNRSNLDWDGHAWVTFGEYIADASLVTTAYHKDAPPLVARHIRGLMRANQRLYIATPEAARREDALNYTQLHVSARLHR